MKSFFAIHLLGSVCGILIIGAGAEDPCTHLRPCALKGGQTFQAPRELRSSNGKLEFTLEVKMGTVSFDWLTTKRRTYNGSIPGPTWRIKAGDEVILTLVNSLTQTNQDNRPHNTFRTPNHTNMHTHGLHVSSKEPQDSVFVEVEPGHQYTYRYSIHHDHPSGTYWYHAHVHGSTFLQVLSGLAGMIIVEDKKAGLLSPGRHLEKISCPQHCEHEVVLVFHPSLQYTANGGRHGFGQIQQDIEDDQSFRLLEITEHGTTLEDWLADPSNGISHYTTNGLLKPKLTIQARQRKRFRMVNAAGTKILELIITDENGVLKTDGCDVWEIAVDGVYLNEGRKPRLDKSLLVPGSRRDWIVLCHHPGVYELRSVPDSVDSCSTGVFSRHSDLLLTIEVTGLRSNLPPPPRLALPPRQSFISDFREWDSDRIIKGFVVELSSALHLNRALFPGKGNYRYKVKLGSVQEWTLVNADPLLGHPLHIHVNHFQVIRYNQYIGAVSQSRGSRNTYYSLDGTVCHYQSPSYQPGTDDFDGVVYANDTGPCNTGEAVKHHERIIAGGIGTLGYATIGDFHDVILLPPLSNITVRFMADSYTGEVVMHCHILPHEDQGMMMTVDITAEESELVGSPNEDDRPSGKCF